MRYPQEPRASPLRLRFLEVGHQQSDSVLGPQSPPSDIEHGRRTSMGFKDATDTFHINVGDILVVYVYLDPAHPTERSHGRVERRFALNTGLTGATTSLPPGRMGRTAGVIWDRCRQWVNGSGWKSPASLVGLEGSTLTGMCVRPCMVAGLTWDAAGKATQAVLRSATNWRPRSLPPPRWPPAPAPTSPSTTRCPPTVAVPSLPR